MPSHTRRRQLITKWREPFCWGRYHLLIVMHTGRLVTGHHVPIHRDRTTPRAPRQRTVRPGQPDADPDTGAAIRPPPESPSWKESMTVQNTRRVHTPIPVLPTAPTPPPGLPNCTRPLRNNAASSATTSRIDTPPPYWTQLVAVELAAEPSRPPACYPHRKATGNHRRRCRLRPWKGVHGATYRSKSLQKAADRAGFSGSTVSSVI